MTRPHPWHTVATVAIVLACVAIMIGLTCSTGCATVAAVPLYPQPVPALDLPDLAPIPEPQPDECPGASAYIPGELAPLTDEEGRASCRGILLSQDAALRAYRAAELRDWYRARAELCTTYRTADRAHAERAVAALRGDTLALRREAAALRVAVPAAALVGLVVGVLVGVAADDLATVVP